MLRDVLYYLFIFPLQTALDSLLAWLQTLSGSYGIGIVALSLLVNLFLLKIMRFSDKKASAINALKSKLDLKITQFKRAFRGAELNAYIRTLYKQNHYHPIYTLSTLGGLAIQVPFFIAVICMIGEIEALRGTSFLWTSDLSRPDCVAFCGTGFELHLLPMLMTIFTLVNVFISQKTRGARVQGILIALIFLVLLYNMPSALVLYWCVNMLFALAKSAFVCCSCDGCIFKRQPQTTKTT